jgi:hypothetical protein
MNELTEFDKWILDQALDRFFTMWIEGIRQDEEKGKKPIFTSLYLEMTAKEIYLKLKLNKSEKSYGNESK